jgi:3-deoxy-D-manno-octulosonate 8-phosphate phosphatase (KDO 8-P phosphatase)
MPMTKQKKYLTKATLAKRLSKIKALILDVDGVLTDDHLYVGANGFELKQFHIGDGLTIVLAMRAGLEVVIMSNRPSEATTTRMNDLKVKHVIQERGDKARIVKEYFENNLPAIDMADAAYMGNDILDITLLNLVGLKLTVADAYDEVKAIVDYVTTKKGGHGAVREVLELYFQGRGQNPADFLKR